MTQEEKVEKMQQGRKNKTDRRVKIEIGKYVIESYDYGWKLYEKKNEFEKLFFKDFEYLLLKLHGLNISKSGAKKVETLLDAITESKKEILAKIDNKE